MSELYDVIVIGGGPAGLTAAQYASRARLKTIVLDKSKSAGALAYASLIENYPGFKESIAGKELLRLFREQAIAFGADYKEAQVIGLRLDAEIKEVYTMDSSYQGKTLIIATGSMGRKATIKGEAEFLGRGVSYCAVCDAAFYRGKSVCVVGSSEEAVKEAVYLTRFADKVCLISPAKLRERPEEAPANLEVVEDTPVVSIFGDDTVKGIKVKDKDGVESDRSFDGVFIYLQGSKPITDFLGETLKLSENGCIEVNEAMETSVAGVFAAGDVTCGEIRQVIVAAAQGAIAALSAEKYLSNRKRTRLDWHK